MATPTNKWEKALGEVYDLLCELERHRGNNATKEEALLMHRAIERCKYWKQPEFDNKFADDDKA